MIHRCVTSLIHTALIGLSLAMPIVQAAEGTVERMYVLECGRSTTPDVSANWSPGVNVGVSWEFSDNCYLIRKNSRWMLWDSGMSDAIAEKPDGVVAASGLLTLRVRKTLISQLRALGLSSADVTDIAFSHFHGDHVGNANLFTAAKHYIQRREYEAAFGASAAKFGYAPALYDKIAGNTRVDLDGDHDVFGDGSVVILSTPGHTPGHQSLMVRLPVRGAVVLSGDMVHFEDNWQQRRVPARNFDAAQSRASMERVAELLRTHKAQLWINHDRQQSDAIPKAPEAVE